MEFFCLCRPTYRVHPYITYCSIGPCTSDLPLQPYKTYSLWYPVPSTKPMSLLGNSQPSLQLPDPTSQLTPCNSLSVARSNVITGNSQLTSQLPYLALPTSNSLLASQLLYSTSSLATHSSLLSCCNQCHHQQLAANSLLSCHIWHHHWQLTIYSWVAISDVTARNSQLPLELPPFLHTVKQYLSFTGNLQPPFELPKQIFSGQECLRCCWPKPRL